MIVVPPSPSFPSHAIAEDGGESLISGEMASETIPSASTEETGRDGDIAEAVLEAFSPDKSLVERLFDRVIVISLEQSADRRAHIVQHLPAFGIRQYEFFTATSATDPLVAQAYSDGEVATFPPCFRCGQIDCGNPDCNNFLIPQQVATFITYRRLWQALAEGDAGRMLVVEDDVRFHDHITTVLTFLEAEIAAGRIPFEAEKPCLIRLGWALCADHENFVDCSVSSEVKMANPCHAITREYARALLSRYAGIHHTVDEFQHRQAPQPGEAFTVHPPIASELSWSDGAFDSLIHPKVVRSAYLRSHDRQDEAEANDRLVEKHIKKKYYRPILVVGHPRCGTGYAAGLCRQLGVDVGHEKLGKDGISSWMFAVEADQNPYFLDDVAKTRRALAWRHLVMPVRNLLDAAPSVMRELQYAPPAYEFLKTHIRQELGIDLEAFDNPLERAVWSITSWTRIILAMNPGLWFRIEDGHERLKKFLSDNGLLEPQCFNVLLDTQPVNADKYYRGVKYPKPVIIENEWQLLGDDTKTEIRWYCSMFGYNNQMIDHIELQVDESDNGIELNRHKYVFICGLHRSGTTILADCLAQHIEISSFKNTGYPKNEGQFLQSVYLPAREFGGPGKFGFRDEMYLTEQSELVTSANKKKLMAEWNRYWDMNCSVLLEKSPPNILKTRFLQAMVPNSYFIIIIRNPIAVSYATMKWSNTSIFDLINHWVKCHLIIENDLSHLRKYFVLKYEDFVLDSQGWLNKICDFINIDHFICTEKIEKDLNNKYLNQWEETLATQKNIAEKINHSFTESEKIFNRFGYCVLPKI